MTCRIKSHRLSLDFEVRGTGTFIYALNDLVMCGFEKRGYFNPIGGSMEGTCPICNMQRELFEEAHVSDHEVFLISIDKSPWFMLQKTMIFVLILKPDVKLRMINRRIQEANNDPSLPRVYKELYYVTLIPINDILDDRRDKISQYLFNVCEKAERLGYVEWCEKMLQLKFDN